MYDTESCIPLSRNDVTPPIFYPTHFLDHTIISEGIGKERESIQVGFLLLLLFLNDPSGTEETRQVVRITQHKDYKHESDTHDVALLVMDKQVVFGADINAICLPADNEVLPVGSKCFMSGKSTTYYTV